MSCVKLFISNTDPQSKQAVAFLHKNKIPTEVYEWHNQEDLLEFDRYKVLITPTLIANNERYTGITQIQLAFA